MHKTGHESGYRLFEFFFAQSLFGSTIKCKSFGRLVKRNILRIRSDENTFYFGRHPILWWRRFLDSGAVEIRSYRFPTPAVERILIPDNRIGSFIYDILFKFESTALSKYFSDYYIVTLKKDKTSPN